MSLRLHGLGNFPLNPRIPLSILKTYYKEPRVKDLPDPAGMKYQDGENYI